MLYKKNQQPKLDLKLFQTPTAEYRGAPFWAWNCKLEQKELEWQLEVLKQMGFGGAHLHVRTGMATSYLSDEYMALVRACVQKAKSEQMLAWLYDEDRWPSGAAGGLVTKDEQYRARFLRFTPKPSGKGKLLACYDIQLDADGFLQAYSAIPADAPAKGAKWYAYLELPDPDPWYNNQTYVNTLDKKAMDRFIEITYESYNRTVSGEFDQTIPAIFTDEPQFTHKSALLFATDQTDLILPWSDDLPQTFEQAYGEDLLAGVPELVWDKKNAPPSLIRYHYHDHICERFTQAFADNCGGWCREHHLALTGHMMEEPTLKSQTAALGEAMRSYCGFELPGIDMLCAGFEYTTAKQAQSAVHQFGREGMLSELYGVTNWDFDFRGHKLHGDWQAALGVTVRVPHLSWVSMAGEAKRDYPASISYQSPWWRQYSRVEDHFARLNTALTRGKPVVKVGVIHPIESYWLHWGPMEQTALIREELDENFQNITKWLLFGGIDFDFISESLLPELCKQGGAPLPVGAMAYDVVIVPGCETLRATTLDRLEDFVRSGGRLIFAGPAPVYEDAKPSLRPQKLAEMSLQVPFTRGAVLTAAEPARLVELRDQAGSLTGNLLCQLRQDTAGRWLFIAHGTEPYNKDISRFQELRIRLDGCWEPTLYNTLTGETAPIPYTVQEGKTEITHRLYDYDSLLLWLQPVSGDVSASPHSGAAWEKPNGVPKPLPKEVPYTLSEPNALLLDMAEYSLDGGAWQPEEEILRLDDNCRAQLGLPQRKKAVAQPWVIPDEPLTHTVRLRWSINAAQSFEGSSLAIEDAEKVRLWLNGAPVENKITGWYTDKSIQTVALPPLHPGENLLEAEIPFGARANLEWAYLLGNFGVEANGRHTRLIPARKLLSFGDITAQGLPFYGGNITYHLPVHTEGGAVQFRSGQYRGALQTLRVDDGEELPVIYPPYTLTLPGLAAGEHVFHLTLYGHRRNGFGPVHLADLKERWIGPNSWRTTGDCWCYDYRLAEEGVLSTPEILEQKPE